MTLLSFFFLLYFKINKTFTFFRRHHAIMNNLNLPIDGTIDYDIVCLHKLDKHYSMPFHKHKGYELELYISGNVNLITDKSTYHMQSGFLTLVPPGVWHRTVSVDESTPYERIVLNLKKDLLSQISTRQTNLADCFYKNNLSGITILRLNSEEMSKYIKLCHTLIPIITSTDFGADVRRYCLLSEILLIANKDISINSQNLANIIPTLITQLTEYVDKNLANNLSLTAFSNDFFLNPAYISRYFKSYMGISLHTYIVEKRIEFAKTLLIQGNSVSDTCTLCGFNNYSNFIRTFKKHVGIAPGHYRH